MPAPLSLRVINYKAFGETPQGFDEIRTVNLVLGRNNSGKSALLDAVRYLTQGTCHSDPLTSRGAGVQELEIVDVFTETALREVFRAGRSTSDIRGDHWRFATDYVGQPLTYRLGHNTRTLMKVEPEISNGRVREMLADAM